jgi:preprotein translocase subunit SecE
MATATAEKQSIIKVMANYFKEVKSELKKVIWPTFPKVAKNTGIVLVAIIASACVIAIFDYAFGLVFQKLLGI